MEIWGKKGKAELLSTRDCGAGYAPAQSRTLPDLSAHAPQQ